MTHFYRRHENTAAEKYKAHLFAKEGYMTSRQGYSAVELGYPITVREDLPEHRSRDGSQMGPVFHNPDAPWHAHENAKGKFHYQHHHALSKEEGHSIKNFGAMDLIPTMEANSDSFKNGHYYPYKRNHTMYGNDLPQGDWQVPVPSPSNFHHKSDELRKWLFGLR